MQLFCENMNSDKSLPDKFWKKSVEKSLKMLLQGEKILTGAQQ